MKEQFVSEAVKILNLDEYDEMLVRHGIDIILCDGSEVVTVLLVSLLSHQFLITCYYIIVFGFLRVNCGGWHAKTAECCFVVYCSLYLLFLMLYRIIIPEWAVWTLLLVNIGYIIINCPVQHIFNPLSKKEVLMSRKKTCIFLSVICFVQQISVVRSVLLRPNLIILMLVSCSMMFLKRSEFWRKV